MDNWGDLENLVQKVTQTVRICLFSGPVLDPEDPTLEGRDLHGKVKVQIPVRFWKIIVEANPEGPRAYGFVLKQDLANVPTEFPVPDRWKPFLKSIADIEDSLGGLVSLEWFKRHDAMETTEGRELAGRIGLDRQ